MKPPHEEIYLVTKKVKNGIMHVCFRFACNLGLPPSRAFAKITSIFWGERGLAYLGTVYYLRKKIGGYKKVLIYGTKILYWLQKG